MVVVEYPLSFCHFVILSFCHFVILSFCHFVMVADLCATCIAIFIHIWHLMFVIRNS